MIMYDYDSHDDVGDAMRCPMVSYPHAQLFLRHAVGTLNARGRSHGGIRRVQVQPERFLSALGSSDGRDESWQSVAEMDEFSFSRLWEAENHG